MFWKPDQVRTPLHGIGPEYSNAQCRPHTAGSMCDEREKCQAPIDRKEHVV